MIKKKRERHSIRETEEFVSEEVESKPDKIQNIGVRSVRWFTFAARDKSYMRSYVETENKHLNAGFVMGIKYRDQEIHDKSKDIYVKFVNSLRQFGD
jgi:hypothetical protein